MPNTSITIGIGNPTPGALYQYEVGLCAAGNYPFTQITTQTTLTIDLAEEPWYQEGLSYCYRICEVNIDGEEIGCCCEGEGDSPYELIVENRYVRGCCEENFYTAQVESYYEIATGTYTVGNGECYLVGELSTAVPTTTIPTLLAQVDCEDENECTRCQYVLKSCQTDQVFANVILSPYQALNVGLNGDTYLYNDSICFYFDYGTLPNGIIVEVNTADINTNQGCDECENPTPDAQGFTVVDCSTGQESVFMVPIDLVPNITTGIDGDLIQLGGKCYYFSEPTNSTSVSFISENDIVEGAGGCGSASCG